MAVDVPYQDYASAQRIVLKFENVETNQGTS